MNITKEEKKLIFKSRLKEFLRFFKPIEEYSNKLIKVELSYEKCEGTFFNGGGCDSTGNYTSFQKITLERCKEYKNV